MRWVVIAVLLLMPAVASGSDGVSLFSLRIEAQKKSKEVATLNKLIKIIECESRGQHDNIWGKHGEYGWLQFKEKSFYFLAQKKGIKNPKWKNKYHQFIVAKWGIEHGYINWWTCGKGL